jgi:hypothetical protein
MVTGLRVAYHSLGLAYNWPLLPGGRRIKQLYFFKNSASAAGFLIKLNEFCHFFLFLSLLLMIVSLN